MSRHYLEEDLELVQRYFPGAKTVRLRTPFDLTTGRRQRLPRLQADNFIDDTPHDGWGRNALWTN